MTLLKPVSLAFAAASLMAIAGTAMPAPAQTYQSPHQNVIASHRYNQLMRTDRSFREARMRRECGPISDPRLHRQCMASFNRYTRTSAS